MRSSPCITRIHSKEDVSKIGDHKLWIKSWQEQKLQNVPTDFLTMLSCHIVIDETHDVILLKYYRHFIIGDRMTSPKMIESYIRGLLNWYSHSWLWSFSSTLQIEIMTLTVFRSCSFKEYVSIWRLSKLFLITDLFVSYKNMDIHGSILRAINIVFQSTF